MPFFTAICDTSSTDKLWEDFLCFLRPLASQVCVSVALELLGAGVLVKSGWLSDCK